MTATSEAKDGNSACDDLPHSDVDDSDPKVNPEPDTKQPPTSSVQEEQVPSFEESTLRFVLDSIVT